MTFGQGCALLAADAAADGDLVVQIPSAPPYFGTPFGTRVEMALRAFSRETLLFFEIGAALNLQAGDWQVNLTDGTRSTVGIFEPWEIWLDGTYLTKVDWAGLLPPSTPVPLSGRPSAYAVLTNGKVAFNNATAEDISGYVRGFCFHPAIVSDESTLDIPLEYFDLFSAYATALLSEHVAGDEVGVARLQRMDSKMVRAIQTLRGDQLSKLLGDE